MTLQKVLVFQRDGLGGGKVKAIGELADDIELKVVDVVGPFPPIIDSPEENFPDNTDELIEWSELILDHLYHPDLTAYLVDRAKAFGRDVIASGRKHPEILTPSTCCTLGKFDRLGAYAEHFGAPEFEVKVSDDGVVEEVKVLRGAPCGATWEAAKSIVGMKLEEALPRIGLSTQFNCFAKANPNVFLTNPLHVAGEIHISALEKALKKVQKG